MFDAELSSAYPRPGGFIEEEEVAPRLGEMDRAGWGKAAM